MKKGLRRGASGICIPGYHDCDGVVALIPNCSNRLEIFEINTADKFWLIMDSGQFGMLRDQQLQKGAEQAFTPDADVIHELEEAQVQR